jgi:hypothetical protein
MEIIQDEIYLDIIIDKDNKVKKTIEELALLS